MLRKPQLEAARVAVEAAQASLDQARLDLGRTAVKAPMDAHVLAREVDVGSRVTPSDTLGRLVGIETYWVEVSVPLSKVRWIDVPDGADKDGSEVTLRNRTAWPAEASRSGRVFKLIGALDERTRMVRLLVAVDDPLARAEGATGPSLIVGEYVAAQILGNPIASAVKLDRAYLRARDTAWVYVDGALEIRELEIATRDAEFAYVTGGLNDGDKLVTSNLATVTDGARLRIREGEAADE